MSYNQKDIKFTTHEQRSSPLVKCWSWKRCFLDWKEGEFTTNNFIIPVQQPQEKV